MEGHVGHCYGLVFHIPLHSSGQNSDTWPCLDAGGLGKVSRDLHCVRGVWVFGSQPAWSATDALQFTKCCHMYYFICFSSQPMLQHYYPYFIDKETDQHSFRTFRTMSLERKGFMSFLCHSQHMTMQKLVNLFVPQLSHLCNRGNRIYLLSHCKVFMCCI